MTSGGVDQNTINEWEGFTPIRKKNREDAIKELCGEHSWFCKKLREDVDEISKKSAFLCSEEFLSKVPTIVNGEVENRLYGIKAALDIYSNLYGSSKGSKVSENEVLQKAIEAINFFDVSWGNNKSKPHVSGVRSNSKSLHERLLESLAFESGSRSIGYWILYDLFSYWRRDESHKQVAKHHAITPIIAVGVDAVLWLRVELFPEMDGELIPDLRYLGLTNIGPCSLGHIGSKISTFHASIQQAWDYCGLRKSYRGRWQLMAQPLNHGKGECVLSDLTKLAPVLDGYSAQLAFTVALLAASGNPYGNAGKVEDENFDPYSLFPEPLDQHAAITARLQDGQNLEVGKRGLDKVGSLFSKYEAAMTKGLSLVLLADTQDVIDAELSKIEKDSKSSDYKGILTVERVKTVEEALDAMLVTNRYLKKYQSKVRDSWLQQWEDGTARFEGDVADGPDRKNKREKSEQT